jgi:hypothetical protein
MRGNHAVGQASRLSLKIQAGSVSETTVAAMRITNG